MTLLVLSEGSFPGGGDTSWDDSRSGGRVGPYARVGGRVGPYAWVCDPDVVSGWRAGPIVHLSSALRSESEVVSL